VRLDVHGGLRALQGDWRCLVTATVDRARVRVLERLPKPELIARCEAAGTIGPLSKWSKFDLATEAARAEQAMAS
jgi:hypothetical protein